MLLGLVRPNAGTGTVLGATIEEPGRYLSRVGALIESPAFYPALSGSENLQVFATVGGHDAASIPGLLELVGLAGRGRDRYRSYSLGMKQRLGIAAALLGDPELLLLDEPANGLDPQGVRDMRTLVGELAGEGRTLLVSSHDLSELEQIADWLVLIDEGRSVYQGPTRSLIDGATGGLAIVAQRATDQRTLAQRLAAARPRCRCATRPSGGAPRRAPRRSRPGRGRQQGRVRRRDRARRARPAPHHPRRPLPLTRQGRCQMTRIIHAELLRLLRRRTIVVLIAGSAAFSVVATLAIFSSAETRPVATRQGGATLAALSGPGGGTEAFAVGASFAGFLVFVTFIALVAGEFSSGTFRALVVRDPHRLRVIVGKLTGILLVAAGVIALTEVLVFGVSLLAAPANDISTTSWFSLQSLGDALGDYLTVLGGVVGWAIFGTTLAVIFRSIPLALGVGFAWAGPFENIVVDSWSDGYRVFPGQVLASLIRGGTVELGMTRAVLTALLYTAIAATTALVLVSRRDVTA